jgi:hypothetical protein
VNLTPNVTQNTSTAEPTLLAPLCATTSVENSSYSWALITSSPHLSSNLSVASTTSDFSVPQDTKTPPPYDEGVHLGFTFHKSSSQRFLDGQPRERRKRSTHQKHRNSTSSSCSTSSCTRPVTSVPPVVAASIDTNASMYLGLTTPPPASISPPSGTETMDFQFDYVSDQLNAFLANPSPPDDLVNTEELTAILNEVLQSGPQEVYSFKESPPPPPLMPPPIVKSECGSFSDKCCQRNGPTESVVITITPLTEPFVKSSDQQPTTTRIVSCHCGAQCKCPGCLVHPSNSALFQNDPYTSNISSSSSCYGSDDELNTFAFTNTAF